MSVCQNQLDNDQFAKNQFAQGLTHQVKFTKKCKFLNIIYKVYKNLY